MFYLFFSIINEFVYFYPEESKSIFNIGTQFSVERTNKIILLD